MKEWNDGIEFGIEPARPPQGFGFGGPVGQPQGFGFGIGGSKEQKQGNSLLNKNKQIGGNIQRMVERRENMYSIIRDDEIREDEIVKTNKFVRYVGNLGMLYLINVINLLRLYERGLLDINIYAYRYNNDIIQNLNRRIVDERDEEMYYRKKYIKYKEKYLKLKNKKL